MRIADMLAESSADTWLELWDDDPHSAGVVREVLGILGVDA